MEQFGARDASAGEFCIKLIEECELFVGILGHMYGSVDPTLGKSFTELEFDTARRMQKPRLLFLSREDAPIPMQLVESDELRSRQSKLRRQHAIERIRDTFTTATDLAERVVLAIRNWENSSREQQHLVKSFPPQPRFEHPYPLQENFTGRIREREMLSAWLMEDDNPVLGLTAIGGMGKSALAWAWSQRDVLGLPLPGTADDESTDTRIRHPLRPAGVFWWSFYEGEATFSTFVDAALSYATSGRDAGFAHQTDAEKAKALAACLQQQRLLMVLDGFERQLSGYSSLNAAYQGDVVDDGDREFADPTTRDFFRHFLAALGWSRILITTRLFPIELEGRAGCRREDLERLSPEDGERFLRSQGVKGGSVEIRSACEAYGYHALALRLLAGFVAHDAVYPGDIRVAVEFDANNKLVSRKHGHHVLELAYNALGSSERLLLSQLAAFRFPVNYITLEKTLCVPEESESLGLWSRLRDLYAQRRQWHKRQELRLSLRQLISRGLLFFDHERQRYDLHPIVRHYAYDRLSDKKGMHTRLIDYYRVIPVSEAASGKTIEDLAPTIELFHHTVRARLYEGAFQLFADRLQEPLLKRFCAVHLYTSLIDVFFDSEDSVTGRLSGSAKTMAMACRAHSLKLSGEPRRAIALYEDVVSTYRRDKNERELSVALLQEGLASFVIGDLSTAEKQLWSAVRGCEYHHQREYAFLAQEMLLQIYALEGRDDDFDKINGAISSLPDTFNRVEATVLRNMFDESLETALSNARRGVELALASGNEMDRIRSKCLLGTIMARHCHESGSTDLLRDAEKELKEAHERCLSIQLVESEVDAWLGFAWWNLAAKDGEGASEAALRARTIADKSSYAIKLAFACWASAEVSIGLSSLESVDSSTKALANLRRARDLAYVNGPPHYLRPFVEKLDRQIAQLCTSRSAAKRVG